MEHNKHFDVRKFCMTAVFVVLIIVMAFTPLGYLRVGGLSITFLMIPVTIGSMLLGPWIGALLGLVFGITSFAQCFGIDWFGTSLATINPFYMGITCFIPRIIAGMLPSFIFKAVNSIDKTRVLSYPISCLSGAVLNTVLFLGALMLFYGRSEFISGFGDSFWAIIWALAGINAIVEAIACCILGGAVAKALDVFVFKNRK